MMERKRTFDEIASTRRTPLFVALAVVALVGAFAVGRYSGYVDIVPRAPQGDVNHKIKAEGEAAQDACCAENARLRQQVLQLEQQARATEARAKLKVILAGAGSEPEDFDIDPSQPVAWPEDTPELYQEESFRRIVTEMAEQVGPPVELLGIDCDEAPCYAALHVGPGEMDCLKMAGVPAWVEAYHGGCSAGSGIRTCDDGNRDKICIIGKGWEGWSDKVREHVFERNDARREEMLDTWACKHERK
jgi:hypothetical protein